MGRSCRCVCGGREGGEEDITSFEEVSIENSKCCVAHIVIAVSCIKRCPHFRGILKAYLGHTANYPLYRGVLISGVSFKRGSTVITSQ